jgi:hypothetical protein
MGFTREIRPAWYSNRPVFAARMRSAIDFDSVIQYRFSINVHLWVAGKETKSLQAEGDVSSGCSLSFLVLLFGLGGFSVRVPRIVPEFIGCEGKELSAIGTP